MKIKIDIKRSEEWVAQQRLARGENVPDQITVEIDPAQLSLEARAVLLRVGEGKYPDHWRGGYNANYLWSYSSWGQLKPEIDSDEPTPEEIEAAILRADMALAERAAERSEEIARRDAEDKARQAKEQARQEAIRQAEELLADRLAHLEKCNEDRKTLSWFLSHVPEDAKRGTLKRLTAEALPEQIEELRHRIEDASPEVYVFDDDR